ncbi:hypothetical protein MBLNU230_g2982t1 [Neophaeotheca triangularis]
MPYRQIYIPVPPTLPTTYALAYLQIAAQLPPTHALRQDLSSIAHAVLEIPAAVATALTTTTAPPATTAATLTPHINARLLLLHNRENYYFPARLGLGFVSAELSRADAMVRAASARGEEDGRVLAVRRDLCRLRVDRVAVGLAEIRGVVGRLVRGGGDGGNEGGGGGSGDAAGAADEGGGGHGGGDSEGDGNGDGTSGDGDDDAEVYPVVEDDEVPRSHDHSGEIEGADERTNDQEPVGNGSTARLRESICNSVVGTKRSFSNIEGEDGDASTAAGVEETTAKKARTGLERYEMSGALGEGGKDDGYYGDESFEYESEDEFVVDRNVQVEELASSVLPG